MAGPIVTSGQLIGAVGCTCEKSMPAFDAQDLADLGAVCLHLSTWAAIVRLARSTTGLQPQPLSSNRLTARELQIANLVALGRTNAAIGNELWITENSVKQALKRMFHKLNISSHIEIVAQLFTTQPYIEINELPQSSLISHSHQ